MTPSARDPLAAYLLVQAGLLRTRDLHPVLAAHAHEHTQHLEGLAAFVRSLPESDERLLLLGTLAVRNGQLVPGGATQHALLTFVGTSPATMRWHGRAPTASCRSGVRAESAHSLSI